MKQYIVGYGSLMNNASKHRTYPGAGENIPVMIQGFERGWFSRGFPLGFSTTFLGVEAKKTAIINASIFEVPDARLIKQYDAREKSYCRILIDSTSIKLLVKGTLPKGQFWIYMPPLGVRQIASEKFPIVQSYVDIFLSGCLDLQNKYRLKDFTKNCINYTSNWSSHWVNDRIYPRRPFIYQPNAAVIDSLLAQELPNYFEHIKIE